ncbi:LuxR C-terminal-related transcriptional regulator [Streptomyces sp. NPDC008092]|uniref:response regulator transcription factor n=1 Tax=Streptomyces sp. NPDC008092 TaxID=3364808 RepID=UPI0036E93DCC
MTAPVQVGPSSFRGGLIRSLGPIRDYPKTLEAQPRTGVTGRQIQILLLAANGNTNRAIGRQLDISEESVKTHMQSLLRKLRVRDRAQAVAVALRLGLISLEQVLVPEGANYDCRRPAGGRENRTS